MSTPFTAPLSAEDALRFIQAKARYLFEPAEFAALTGRNDQAVSRALWRLARQGHVVSASKHPSMWLIVPPEHSHYGVPPFDWWLDAYLRESQPGYYLALLSAARYWGSAHYARQTVQVMLGSQRAPQSVGRMRIEYCYKRHVERTPVVDINGTVARFRVSTREATLLDLVRHLPTAGGIESVARIAKDFSPSVDRKGLIEALDALDQTVAAQRLGFVLEGLGLKKLAIDVEDWLRTRRRTMAALEPGRKPGDTGSRTNPRWSIAYSDLDAQTLEELR